MDKQRRKKYEGK